MPEQRAEAQGDRGHQNDRPGRLGELRTGDKKAQQRVGIDAAGRCVLRLEQSGVAGAAALFDHVAIGDAVEIEHEIARRRP